MTVIREVGGKWCLKATTVDRPLQKGSRLVLDPKALKRDAETSCRLLEWQYRIASEQTGDHLELIVEEMQPGPWESWFARWSPDTQFFAPAIAAIVSLILICLVWITFRSQPELGWTLAGRYIRTTGGCAIFLVFALLLPLKLGLYSGRPNFRKPFFSVFLTDTGFILVGVWLMFSARPEHFGGSDADYAAYAMALVEKLSTSYWPLLVAALPWLSIGFKVFGLDVAEKTAEGLEKAATKD